MFYGSLYEKLNIECGIRKLLWDQFGFMQLGKFIEANQD